MPGPVDYADSAIEVILRIREHAPRVHCITNTVAQQFTANVLLAVGAVPSMTISPLEIGNFVAGADALLVNLGTFDAERRAAIETALGAAAEHGRPWLLDPVFIERSPARAEFARGLVGRSPVVVRLNAAEFAALSGNDQAGDAPARFAKTHGTIVALTGRVDLVSDGVRRVKIANGDPLMGQVTAMGCAGSALLGAALAVERDPWLATIAALTAFGIAGEVAGRDAAGPGSFAVAIIDALHGLDGATLRAHLKVHDES
ncbi:MAG TPA: hydroxyethylthiazole kinase [Xanthobacteraceae bacterium]|nr:hydroxyethylthiazole kinase [Xanthobacteraceae bacterium]